MTWELLKYQRNAYLAGMLFIVLGREAATPPSQDPLTCFAPGTLYLCALLSSQGTGQRAGFR